MARYTAVQDNLTLATAYVKNWLKVDDTTDDTLIGDLIDIAKEIADNFIQNDFKMVLGEEVGIGDDSTLIFQLDNFPVIDQSLKLYLLRPGTDINLDRANPGRFGFLQEQDTNDATADYALNLTTGAITFASSNVPEQGDIVYAHKYRLSTGLSVPKTVEMGVLKMIAYLYEDRTGGVQIESVEGLGSIHYMKVAGWNVPTDVIALWAPYRKLPGL